MFSGRDENEIPAALPAKPRHALNKFVYPARGPVPSIRGGREGEGGGGLVVSLLLLHDDARHKERETFPFKRSFSIIKCFPLAERGGGGLENGNHQPHASIPSLSLLPFPSSSSSVLLLWPQRREPASFPIRLFHALSSRCTVVLLKGKACALLLSQCVAVKDSDLWQRSRWC